MIVTYIGTAAAEAIPALFCQCQVCENARKNLGREFRSRSGAVIGDNLLIDFPPDVYHSTIRAGVYLPGIKDIFITHSHEDHCDPDELANRITPVTCKRKPGEDYDTNVYGNIGVIDKLSRLSGKPGIKLHHIKPFEPITTNGYTVTPLKTQHMKIEEAYIYLIEQNGKRFLYGNDTGFFPNETIDYLTGKYLDAVSLDCTYAMMHCEKGWGHMSLALNVELKDLLISRSAADQNTIFIAHHFSHNGFIPDGRLYTLEELEKIAAERSFLVSYDGMKVEF